MKRFLALTLICLSCITASADEATPKEMGGYAYPTKVSPEHIDNYLFTIYFSNGKKAYNLRSMPIASAGGGVEAIKINPSGTSFALLYKDKKNSGVSVYNLWQANKVLHTFKDIPEASAIAYSPDARTLFVSVPGMIKMYDPRTFEPKGEIATDGSYTDLVVSGNGYYLAGVKPASVTVWNLENKTVRREFDAGETVKDVTFSPDNSQFAILTVDGMLNTYGTLDFLISRSFEGLGDALSCSFHPDGKYISVVTGDNRIALVNLMDEAERSYVDSEEGGIKDVRFLRDGKKQTFLTYNTASKINYLLMDAKLTPNYTKLLAEELEERMNEWMKQLPDETLEEYKLRVNDETRLAQMKIFEAEIATRMADDLVGMSEVTLGNYNAEAGVLGISFNNMPEIFLNVPASDLNDFMNPGQLEFRNAKYGITPQDKFELIYAEVVNKASGKSYIYDNLDRRSMDYLTTGDSFVPLDVIQQSNLEELILQEIKEKVVNLAKENKTISDHTQISVNANVVTDHDASGKRILNYKIDFAYEVEPGFSAQEDFAPGKYHVGESGAASSMLAIVKDAFENDFKQYVKNGKKLMVRIYGMADALPINGRLAYDGIYGDFVDEPVYKNGDLSSLTVTKKDGITENEQLALVRAAGVKDYLSKNVPTLGEMDTDYTYDIEVTQGKGGEYRRIKVEFMFVDAF